MQSMADKQSQSEQYLGDGVFARLDALGNVILTTSDGERVTNVVYLDPHVVEALLLFLGQEIER